MTTFYSRRASEKGSYNIQRALPPTPPPRPELPTRTWPDWPTRFWPYDPYDPHRRRSCRRHRHFARRPHCTRGIRLPKNQQLLLLLPQDATFNCFWDDAMRVQYYYRERERKKNRNVSVFPHHPLNRLYWFLRRYKRENYCYYTSYRIRLLYSFIL